MYVGKMWSCYLMGQCSQYKLYESFISIWIISYKLESHSVKGSIKINTDMIP